MDGLDGVPIYHEIVWKIFDNITRGIGSEELVGASEDIDQFLKGRRAENVFDVLHDAETLKNSLRSDRIRQMSTQCRWTSSDWLAFMEILSDRRNND